MTIMHMLHQLGVARLLASAPVMTLASRKRGIASIFMLHRFAGPHGHDPLVLKRLLGWLRRHNYELLDLEMLFRRMSGDGEQIRHAVAFTIDDGYQCQAEIAAPIFAEYGVPVTTFLTTGFLDGTLWLWWDQIDYIFSASRADRVSLVVGGKRLDFDLGSPERRHLAAETLKQYCKALPESERLLAIAELAAEAAVGIPESPPPEYRPMMWDQARRLEAGGMRFGAHTVTHPILARTDDAQARHEIEAAWTRLGQEISNPVPVFCYPNGLESDFGTREFSILRDLGFIGAVAAEPGYASSKGFAQADGRFRVPRFSFSEIHDENLRCASRMEWLWQKVRLRGN